MIGVYRITNLINGKSYIGASKNIAQRFCQHRFLLDNKKHHCDSMISDWHMHGDRNFLFEVLLECGPESLRDAETFWIANGKDLYNTIIKNKKQKFTKEDLCQDYANINLNDERVFNLRGGQLKVLIHITKHMDKKNTVRISGRDRKDWAEEIGITTQAFNLAFSGLIRSGFLVRRANGVYAIDQSWANKGTITEPLTTVDSGEIDENDTPESPYLLINADKLCALFSKNPACGSLFQWMAAEMSWKNTIYLNKRNVERAKEYMNVSSDRTMIKYITNLIDYGAIRQLNGEVYEINSEYFGERNDDLSDNGLSARKFSEKSIAKQNLYARQSWPD